LNNNNNNVTLYTWKLTATISNENNH